MGTEKTLLGRDRRLNPRQPESSDSLGSPRIVAFGGGTGMACLLTGLREEPVDVTAVVSVSDDGGSSGRLRKDFDIAPPGDIRNCLLALSGQEPLWARLLDYRFRESEMAGHSIGNLLITALTRVTGDFDLAIRELNRLLQVRGRVLPANGGKLTLIAHHHDGTKSTGEKQIARSGKSIERLEARPRVEEPAEDVGRAIEEADLIVFGPGSLFTSVVPPLLIEGIRRRVLESFASKVYIANVMTQPGETDDMTLVDHVDALERHAGEKIIDEVIVHNGNFPEELLQNYTRQGSVPVVDDGELAIRGLRVSIADLIDCGASSARHHSGIIGRIICELALVSSGKPA
ncbi:MAG: uridine diphosphate-N-acetylglucosamine-binding protein YvcK [Planctomycetota bacterium]|nr:uridine diphosphate-N-acetylglucosamine-binding protein YvcK [Planctomycetota bacterium]